MNEQLPIILFLIPFATAICMPMIGHAKRNWCEPIALAAIVAMGFTAIANLFLVLKHGETRYGFGGWSISTVLPEFPLGIEWVNDPLASVMIVTLCGVAALCMLFGRSQLATQLGSRSVLYYTLVLVLISSLAGIIFAGDIFNVFVFFEVAALCAYALVGVSGGRALVAAFRYLILGTLGSSFYLLGVVFFYAA
ncbi:MAG: proton-conducting transporter membrane subunit, partial [Pirellulaceae bacterium]